MCGCVAEELACTAFHPRSGPCDPLDTGSPVTATLAHWEGLIHFLEKSPPAVLPREGPGCSVWFLVPEEMPAACDKGLGASEGRRGPGRLQTRSLAARRGAAHSHRWGSQARGSGTPGALRKNRARTRVLSPQLDEAVLVSCGCCSKSHTTSASTAVTGESRDLSGGSQVWEDSLQELLGECVSWCFWFLECPAVLLLQSQQWFPWESLIMSL